MDKAFLRMQDVPSSVIICKSKVWMLPGIFWMYFSIPFFRIPRAPITTGSFVVFMPYIRLISITRSCDFSIAFTEVLTSRNLFCFLFLMTISSLLAFISQFVCTGMSHRIVVSFPTDTV